MENYTLVKTKQFKKDLKKINASALPKVEEVLERLRKGERLEEKYKDHALKGKYKGLRDCHVLPDLVLIYEKMDDIMILSAIRIKNHSNLF